MDEVEAEAAYFWVFFRQLLFLVEPSVRWNDRRWKLQSQRVLLRTDTTCFWGHVTVLCTQYIWVHLKTHFLPSFLQTHRLGTFVSHYFSSFSFLTSPTAGRPFLPLKSFAGGQSFVKRRGRSFFRDTNQMEKPWALLAGRRMSYP